MKFSALCLDANVFVASVMPHEEGHEAALSLMSLVHENGWSLYGPAILPSEVVSNLYRKYRDGDLSEEKKDEAEDMFFQLPLLLQWKPSLLKKAQAIAAKLGLRRIYDCSYLAVAMEKKIPLVTFDRELVQKGKSVYAGLMSVEAFLKAQSTPN